MLTDTHCHLASRKFGDDELSDIVARAWEAGIERIVTLATNLEDIPRNLAIAERFPHVFTCIGIHPCDVQDTPDDFVPQLRDFAAHPKASAIGETGLDYYHPAPPGWSADDYRQRQRLFLRQHFELAADLGLNVVIHTRDRTGDASFSDALAIYEPFAQRVRAVFHCFPGPWPMAERVLTVGGLISFTGIATFKNAADVLDAATKCPADRFMVETDSPYLAPVPHRGKRCEPAYTRLTAEALAAARKESFADLARSTTTTAEHFFRLGN